MSDDFLSDSSLRVAYKVFYKCICDFINDLKPWIDNKSYDELKLSSHKLKGSSYCYGYIELSKILSLLYTECSNESPSTDEMLLLFEKIMQEKQKIDSDFKIIDSLD